MQVVLLCALVAVASVSEVIGLPQAGSQDKPKNQTGCHIEEEGLVIPYGSKAPSKTHCYEYKCNREGIYDTVSVHGCPSMAALPPCYITEDKSKPYPACCPYGKCPDD